MKNYFTAHWKDFTEMGIIDGITISILVIDLDTTHKVFEIALTVAAIIYTVVKTHSMLKKKED